MKQEHKVRYYQDNHYIEIDGEKYFFDKSKYKKIDNVEHLDYIECRTQDPQIEEKRKVIIDKLKDSISTERVIQELTKGMGSRTINHLHTILTKKKAKVKRHDGCLGINIDGGKGNSMYLPIFD